MKIGFVLTAGSDAAGYAAADFLIRSVRRAMPGVPAIQFTDDASPGVAGADEVRRRPAPVPFALLIAEHYAACGPGEWLFIDTDAVVQRDVRPVFAEDPACEVAVTDRVGCYLTGEEGSAFMREMPYNAGVVFSRCPGFWSAILERVRAMPPERQAWLGVQAAVAAEVAAGGFAVRALPGLVYNYPPRAADDPHVADAAIVHYKGPWRKAVLLERIWRETVTASGSSVEVVQCPACALQDGLCADHLKLFQAPPESPGPIGVGLPATPSDVGREGVRPLPPVGTD